MPNKINNNNEININELTNKDNNTSIKPKIMEKIEKMNKIKISEDNQNISVNFEDTIPKENTIKSNNNDNVNIFDEFERKNFNIGNSNNDKCNYMNSTQNLNSKSINLMKSDINVNNNIDEDILNDELDEDNCNYNSTIISNNKNLTIKKNESLKKEDIEEEQNYEKEFEKSNDLSKLEKKSYDNINLNDYKEIRESQQFQNQLNFFESNNNLVSSNIKKSKPEKSPKKNPNILLESESISDSYGDDIINNLNKFRHLALEESTINSKK